MKKALSIILVFAMLLALTACGNNASQNTQNGSEGNQDVTQNETTEAENAEFMPPENYATVLLVTINPQFRLYLDADGNVLAVEAVNKDAKKIAGQLSFETDHYTEAVKKIVTAANENDFIKSTTVIHVEITDTKGSSVDKDEVLNEITTVVNEIAPELKLQVKVKENKPSEGETTIPPQCSHVYEDATCTAPKTCKTCGATDGAANGHSWNDATCTAPKTCKTCGATDGNVLPHDYQNGVCGNCESWQFGYGKWQFFRVEGDTLYIVTLHGNDKGALTGISNSHYQDVDTMEATKKDEYLQAGAQLVTYAGKSYLPMGGLGDPCFFEMDGEMITVHLGEQGASMGEYIILQRTAKDQFAVKQVVGCTAYGIIEGAAFIHQSGS